MSGVVRMVPNRAQAKDVVCSRSVPIVIAITKFKGPEGVKTILRIKGQEEVHGTEGRNFSFPGNPVNQSGSEGARPVGKVLSRCSSVWHLPPTHLPTEDLL